MITRRNCLIGASAALIGAAAIVRAGNVMAIRGVPVQRAFAIGYESIAFIALENCGVAP